MASMEAEEFGSLACVWIETGGKADKLKDGSCPRGAVQPPPIEDIAFFDLFFEHEVVITMNGKFWEASRVPSLWAM